MTANNAQMPEPNALENAARTTKPVRELRPGDGVHFIRAVRDVSWTAAGEVTVRFEDGFEAVYGPEDAVPIL